MRRSSEIVQQFYLWKKRQNNKNFKNKHNTTVSTYKTHKNNTSLKNAISRLKGKQSLIKKIVPLKNYDSQILCCRQSELLLRKNPG